MFKNYKIFNEYVEFSLHPKNLDGISKPSMEELTRLGFNDVNTTLADTVEIMENTPSNGLRKNNKQNSRRNCRQRHAIVRNEMQIMETRLTSQTKNFVTYTTDKAARTLKKEITTLNKIMAAFEFMDMLDKKDSSSDKKT